jgi:glycosyltransferase involved in cell wall biosynthesis
VAWLGHRSQTHGDGIITYSREITAGLKRRGVDVVFFHHSREGSDDEESVALDSFFTSHRLVISRPGSTRRLADLLERHRVDLVHVSLSFASVDDCDAVIIFGDTQREILRRLGVPPDVIHVVPNGVEVDRYSPGPPSRKAEFGADQLFSYVGRLDPEKNVDLLLDAFLRVDPPAGTRFVVVGGGANRRRLQRRYDDGRIAFTGVITDEQQRIELLRSTDAFFLPSSVEGLSLAMLEAMACGCATVATDVGSDGDALRGAGVVLDPRHLEAELRAALRLFVEVPGVTDLLGRQARERAVDRYSLATNLDRLLEIYRDVVARGVPTTERS